MQLLQYRTSMVDPTQAQQHMQWCQQVATLLVTYNRVCGWVEDTFRSCLGCHPLIL